MTLRKKILLQLAVLAAAVAIMLYLRAQLAQAEERLEALAAEQASAVGRARRPVVENPAKRPGPVAGNAPALVKPPGALPPQSGPMVSDLFGRSPEFHAAYLKAYKEEIQTYYSQLFSSLSLRQDLREAFLQAVYKRAEDYADIRAAVTAQNQDVRDPGVQAMLDATLKTREDKIRSLLGEDGYQQYRDYLKNTPARELANDLTARQWDAEEPVSPVQARQLAAVLSAATMERKLVDREIAYYPSPNDTPRVLAEAKRILSPQQFTTFATMIEAQAARDKLRTLTH